MLQLNQSLTSAVQFQKGGKEIKIFSLVLGSTLIKRINEGVFTKRFSVLHA